MKQFGDLIEPEEVVITYSERGEDKTDTFVISKIPAFSAHKIHAQTANALARGDIAALPTVATRELLKYAAHNKIVLDEEPIINVHCPTDEVIIAVAMEVWNRNFGFFETERFRDRMAAIRNMLG